MLNVDHLEDVHSISNLVILSDSFKVSGGSIKDSSKLISLLFSGNTYAYAEGVRGIIPNHPFVGRASIGPSSCVLPTKDLESVKAYRDGTRVHSLKFFSL